jgi:putative Holliday junction resolvase
MIQAAFTRCKALYLCGLFEPKPITARRSHTEKLKTPVSKIKDQLDVEAPVLALDLGEKLVGAAVSDQLLVTTNRLPSLKRSNWKRLLQDLQHLIERFDAKTIVVGLPLRLDGTEGDAATDVRRIAMNLAKSIELPVYLQDERLTSVEAAANLRAEGVKPDDIPSRIDGEAAAIILRAFLDTRQERILVSPSNTRDQENE